MAYSIQEHKHRFAAWAAGRAANVNGCRFSVKQGKSILEKSGLKEIVINFDCFPGPEDFDEHHKKWRSDVICAAGLHGLKFTHGVAAKLINIYLKSYFVCSDGSENEKIKSIHPPIDSVLLDELYSQNIAGKKKDWQAARKIRWSKLSCTQYNDLIKAIKDTVPAGKGLWEIEEYWRGYQ